MVQLAEGLLEVDPCGKRVARPRHLDGVALERARQFLDAEKTRVVRSSELAAVTGLTRYELARQFRVRYGTSPYRYLLMRRLDFARAQLSRHRSLVDVALEAGFADQAHFTRMFKAAFGLTPARYSALRTHEVQEACRPSRSNEQILYGKKGSPLASKAHQMLYTTKKQSVL
jgi:AraC-like DNA-binding protein